MKTIQKFRVLIVLLAMMLLQSCDWFKSEPSPKKSTKAITAIDLSNAENEIVKIDEAKGLIWVKIPWTPNLTMRSVISHTGLKIEPYDLNYQDFTNPVNFTITAEDGSTKVYTVIVSSTKGQVIFNYPSLYRNHDKDFYKYLFAKVGSENGSEMLAVVIGGGQGYAERKDNFGFQLMVRSTGIVNEQPNFVGNFSAAGNTGSSRVLLNLNQMKQIPGLNSNTTYTRGSIRGDIVITSYDSRLRLVSGYCRNLEFYGIETGQIYTASCDFLNVPLE